MSLRWATVLEGIEALEGVQILRVRINDTGETVKACNYLALAPRVVSGQKVLVNTTGLDLRLGTGGTAFVVPSEACGNGNRYGHTVKLRYTPLQTAVDSAEEQASPFHEVLREATSIEGMPVACCELHSQMPLVIAAIKHERPHATVAYIMDDSAALPMAFSNLVRQCRAAGLIDATISCGQAFGGEHEAINVYSALLVARMVCEADVAIVAPGPGLAGSGTVFGHSGIAQGEALNAVAVLEGRPIAPLRLSWKDARSGHHALCRHSETTLGRICLCKAVVPVPGDLSDSQRRELFEQLELSGILEKHVVLTVCRDFSEVSTRGVTVETMGRGRDEDPAFFSASLAAGILAASDIELPCSL